MKATEQYFPVVLFIMLYKVVLTFESVDEILKCDIQMKAIEEYFPIMLFIMLYKVVLTFESVDEILKCDHSNESYWAVLSCGVVYYAVQGGSNFWVCGWNPKVWPFKWKLLRSTFLWCCLFPNLLQMQIWSLLRLGIHESEQLKAIFLGPPLLSWSSNSFIHWYYNISGGLSFLLSLKFNDLET